MPMTQVLVALGTCLLGGVAAAVTGGLVEFVRAMLNTVRREAILHRSMRENLRHFIA